MSTSPYGGENHLDNKLNKYYILYYRQRIIGPTFSKMIESYKCIYALYSHYVRLAYLSNHTVAASLTFLHTSFHLICKSAQIINN